MEDDKGGDAKCMGQEESSRIGPKAERTYSRTEHTLDSELKVRFKVATRKTYVDIVSSEVLKEMSAEQQQRFRVVQTQITNVQTQFLSELERQGLQIRESATNDIKNLQSSTTAQ